MLGSILFCSKLVMQALPNIHLLGMLIMVYTLVYRAKALIPLYIFVFLEGFYALCFGSIIWWVPYLYIWTILWGMTMLLPRQMPLWAKRIVYPAVCALHGFAFGLLYAPAQALLFGFNLKQTVAWVISGLPFDAIHGVSNLICGTLVLPLAHYLSELERKREWIGFFHEKN